MTAFFDNLFGIIHPYAASPDKVLVGVAVQAHNLTVEFENGNLSPDEYKELMNDILDINRIDQLMETQDQKQQIAKVLDLMKQGIFGLLKSMI